MLGVLGAWKEADGQKHIMFCKDSYAGLILYSLRTTLYLLGTAVRHSLLRFSLRQSEELGCGLADEWAGGQAGRQAGKSGDIQTDV